MSPKKKTVARQVKLSVVGMQYRTTPSVRKYLTEHLPFRVRIEREPKNHQDPYAIAVYVDDKGVPYNEMKLGYLRRQVAAVWAKDMDGGKLKIHQAYLHSIDTESGIGELLIQATINTKSLEIAL